MSEEKKIVFDLDSIEEGLKDKVKEELIIKSENQGLSFAMSSNTLSARELIDLGLGSMDWMKKNLLDSGNKKGMLGVG